MSTYRAGLCVSVGAAEAPPEWLHEGHFGTGMAPVLPPHTPRQPSASATHILVIMQIGHKVLTNEAEDTNAISSKTQLSIHIKNHKDSIWCPLILIWVPALSAAMEKA